MEMSAKFEAEGESFDALFNEMNSTFNAGFLQSGASQGGEGGVVFVPYVSDEGVISWTNNGGLQNPKSVNIKGEKGDTGEAGKNGTNGKDGVDGYTPVKGKDYFTETDKAEIVSSVIAALPVYDGSVTVV